MIIEKNDKLYNVTEYTKSWTLSINIGGVPVNYKVSKTDCPTWDELKVFVEENSIF